MFSKQFKNLLVMQVYIKYDFKKIKRILLNEYEVFYYVVRKMLENYM